MAVGFGDRIHHVVEAVVQVHVSQTRWPVERRVARRAAGRRVAGRIVFADIGLGLDDHAGGDAVGRLVNEDLAQQVSDHVERGPLVEAGGQDHGIGGPSSSR